MRKSQHIPESLDVYYQQVFRDSPEATVLVDAMGRIVDVNDSFEKLFQYTSNEAKGKSLDAIVVPKHLMDEAKRLSRSVLEGQMIQHETIRMRKDGTSIHVHTLGFPIWLGKKQIGVFGVYQDITPQKQLEAIRQVGLDLISQLDLKPLLRSIVKHAVELVGGSTGGIYLYRKRRDVLEWAMSVGDALAPVGSTLKKGEGLSGKVWETGKPLVVDDYQNWEGRARIYEGYFFGPNVAAPIYWGKEFLGVVNILAEAPHRFSSKDGELLEMLAAQVAFAIKNARLVEAERTQRIQAEIQADRMQARERFLALLNDLSRAAIESSDLQTLFQTLADRLGELFDADGCFLTLWDEVEQKTIPITAYGALRTQYPELQVEPGEKTMTASVLKEERVLVAEDVLNSPYTSPRIAKMFSTHSMMGLPLIADGQKLGAALIGFDQPHEFTSDEIERGEQVAGQVALVVAKTRLFDRVQRQAQELELLNQVRNAIALKLDLPTVFRTVVEAIAETFGYTFVSLYLLQDDVLVLQHQVGYEKTIPKIPIEKGISGRVFKSKQPVLLEDVQRDPDFLGAIEGIESEVCIPLFNRNKVVGTLNVESVKGIKLSQADLNLMTALGEHINIAIEQARLYSEVRESEEKFRTLFELAGDAILTVSFPEGDVLDANMAAVQMLGYSKEALKTLSGTDIIAPEVLKQTVREWQSQFESKASFLLETVWVRKDDARVPVAVNGKPVEIAGEQLLQLIARDITERKHFEEQLTYLANHDSLTNLFNRHRFEEELNLQLQQANRYRTTGALLWLDMDQFKEVNDSLGHRAGDELLISLGHHLSEKLRKSDVVARMDDDQIHFLARLGGDEFAILLPQTGEKHAMEVADRILNAIQNHSIMIEGQPIRITTSIGIALFPDHGTTVSELLAHADHAMYQAKEQGRNRFTVYVPEGNWQEQLESRVIWARRIREALEEDRFILYAQPILNLHQDQITRYELLLRLRSVGEKIVLPGSFLSIAERFGLIHDLDRWVVESAIRLLEQQQRAGRELYLEINLSSRALTDDHLLPLIQKRLDEASFDPQCLILEITESAAVADLNQARHFIETLRKLKCQFAIDDFGVGFSSFYYLKHLPMDYLKIDGSFIQNLPEDPVDQHLVQAMVQTAKGLGKKTIAEYVEDEKTLELLRQYGVDYAQGYHVGKPLPVEEVFQIS